MCNPDFRNLAYLQTFYNRSMVMPPGLFELCPSLGDNNKLWHFPVSPLLMRPWSGLCYGGAVPTPFGSSASGSCYTLKNKFLNLSLHMIVHLSA